MAALKKQNRLITVHEHALNSNSKKGKIRWIIPFFAFFILTTPASQIGIVLYAMIWIALIVLYKYSIADRTHNNEEPVSASSFFASLVINSFLLIPFCVRWSYSEWTGASLRKLSFNREQLLILLVGLLCVIISSFGMSAVLRTLFAKYPKIMQNIIYVSMVFFLSFIQLQVSSNVKIRHLIRYSNFYLVINIFMIALIMLLINLLIDRWYERQRIFEPHANEFLSH